MISKMWIAALVLSVSCGEKEEELVPLLTGTVTPDHPEYTSYGEFTGYKAFAFDINEIRDPK